METIRFVDTTIRDGHQSLWAENMTTGMMLPIAKKLDDAGFEGIELISGSHLKKSVRELKEDPWERVRLVSKLITKTPLRLIAGRVNTFEYNPPSMYRLFVERMFANGIREARISDGDQVKTGPDGRARVRLDDGTLVAVDARTTFALKGNRLTLETGRIFVQGGRAARTEVTLGSASTTVSSRSMRLSCWGMSCSTMAIASE